MSALGSKPGEIPLLINLCALSPACNGIRRSASGVTPLSFLAASMVAEPHICEPALVDPESRIYHAAVSQCEIRQVFY